MHNFTKYLRNPDSGSLQFLYNGLFVSADTAFCIVTYAYNIFSFHKTTGDITGKCCYGVAVQPENNIFPYEELFVPLQDYSRKQQTDKDVTSMRNSRIAQCRQINTL